MIFVTVGTAYEGFERLIKKMDEIAGEIQEEVIIQLGHTDLKPQNCEYFRFLPPDEIAKFYKAARIVVCHDGAGSILTALKHGKPVVVVPRLSKYAEACYDNKVVLGKELARQGLVALIFEVEEIQQALASATPPSKRFSGEGVLVYRLKEYIDLLAKERGR